MCDDHKRPINNNVDDDEYVKVPKKKLKSSQEQVEDEYLTEDSGRSHENLESESFEQLQQQQQQHSSLREKDMGILNYISKLQGFRGVIKQRYSDFNVQEVQDTGIVELKSLNVPDYKVDEKFSFDDAVKYLPQIIRSNLDKIENDDITNYEIDVDTMSKEDRRKYHKCIKLLYPSLDSSTKTNGSLSKIILVEKSKKVERKNYNWPENKGKYLKFTLYKENKTTMDAISLLAKMLKVKQGCFSFAGTKDKRARTTQKITAFKILPHKLAALNSRLINMAVGDFEFVDKELKLGELIGNQFTIILRSIDGDRDNIDESFKSLKSNGFINYFGMQRFGTTETPTYWIGREILKSNFEKAIDLILTPNKFDSPQLTEAKSIWIQSRDAQRALKSIKKDGKFRNSIELKLLHGLSNCSKNDHVGALTFLPDTSRLLYVHAYQSYIWNRIVSKRIENYGFAIHIGDLINIDGNIVEVDVNHILDYSIEDVLLPLPGYNIQLPNNEVKNWYKEFLGEDELSINDLNHKVKPYALSGTYRNIVVKPQSISWKYINYKDFTKPLFLSDLDKLNGEKLDFDLLNKDNKSDNENNTAILLSLLLPSSSYATMALRELMKCDTSVAVQASLNE